MREREREREYKQNNVCIYIYIYIYTVVYIYADLSLFNDSDHQTNNWLRHPLQQQLQSSVCDNWQWVFHIAVEEFWPTLLCRIVFNSATLEGYQA